MTGLDPTPFLLNQIIQASALFKNAPGDSDGQEIITCRTCLGISALGTMLCPQWVFNKDYQNNREDA